MAFSSGARSAFELWGKRLLEKHAIAPSAARLVMPPCKSASRLSDQAQTLMAGHRHNPKTDEVVVSTWITRVSSR
jgi:hypothetical protein